MSVLVMVYGQSGTGKSTSLRNFKNDEVAVVNVSGKPLPFRGDIKTYNSDNYQKIMANIIGIMGESGSGKTTSMRNLDPKTTYYFDCDKKGKRSHTIKSIKNQSDNMSLGKNGTQREN